MRSPLLSDSDRQQKHGFSETSEDDLDFNNTRINRAVQQTGYNNVGSESDSDIRAPIIVQRKDKAPCFVYMLTFLSAIGGFLFGYDTGVVSGAMLLLREEFALDSVRQELVVSVTIAAAAIFAVVAGYV